MSTLLQIVGNHKLEFNSGQEAINLLVDNLNVEIADGNYDSDNVRNKVNEPSEIKYFVNFEHLDRNFNLWNAIKIHTNYKYCPEINLFRKTISFDNNCTYSNWKDVILKNDVSQDNKNKHIYCQVAWKHINTLSVAITRKIGGNKIILFDDSRFQNEEELYHKGESIETVIKEFSEKWPPTEFEEIINRKSEFNVQNGWYTKRIVKETEYNTV